jgi:hypothetical protein
LARLDESIAAFNQRFILNLWNQGNQTKAKQNLVLIFWRNRQGFLLSAHASTPPLPGSSISKKQFSAETMLFFSGKFLLFSKNTL